ncbi:MAG TPA: EF-P lysine aminoacylase EpmA [Anaeromyxobacteraceae bacterium]|jgi:lysyl-tRNA synthetase class 2|nr:EF-P lysine aminoacylase EpmA [Anaeromyxobacteraceae bacterium]
MDPHKATAARARARLNAALRQSFAARGYEEVETPCLVPAPGMEPHIACFEAPFVPEGGGAARPLWLHSSPEYAMKRLLADGFERIFQLARVFRNGEVSATHNPEFTMLELYRAGADHLAIMEDLEQLVEEAARAVAGGTRVARAGVEVELAAPFERLTVAEAFSRRAGIDLDGCGEDAARLRAAALARGLPVGPEGEGFDDLFFRIFLERVEPGLGAPRPVYLVDWPARMAALAKLTPDGRHARRFELYVGGLELANGFCELNDAVEQRRRLEEERALRVRLGRPAYPLDERFVEAVGRMPDAGGVAVGLDRLLMLLTGAASIEEVLLFPAHQFLG